MFKKLMTVGAVFSAMLVSGGWVHSDVDLSATYPTVLPLAEGEYSAMGVFESFVGSPFVVTKWGTQGYQIGYKGSNPQYFMKILDVSPGIYIMQFCSDAECKVSVYGLTFKDTPEEWRKGFTFWDFLARQKDIEPEKIRGVTEQALLSISVFGELQIRKEKGGTAEDVRDLVMYLGQELFPARRTTFYRLGK